MKKLGLAMLFMLAGCSADYSVDLGNGYSYEHWGNNFIANTVAGEMREVITGQVDSYLKKEALVFAVQTAPAAPGKRYYVLDTGTGELKRFTAQADFLQDTRKLGVADEELLKEHIISPL